MASVIKPTYTIAIPDGAKFMTGIRKVSGQEITERFACFQYKGRNVKALVVAEGRCRVESELWHVRYKDLDGKWRRAKGYSDKRATEALALKIQERVDQKQEGVNPFKEGHEKPLAEHLKDWQANLEDKGLEAGQVKRTVGRVKAIMDGCAFKSIPDITAVDVESWLSKRRNDQKRPMSAQTHNFYVQAFRRFCRWLKDKGRTDRDRSADVAMMKLTDDRRTHNRRALLPDEFSKLIVSAASGPTLQGITGADRAMLYTLAAWTGYRRGELSTLTVRSFVLDAPTPFVAVQAENTKNHKAAAIPLHSVVVERFQAWLSSKGEIDPDAPLFDLKTRGGHWRRTGDMMKADLQRAGLPYQDESGAYADFHANRHTFITNLGRAGVPLTMAQKLARHSDPKLTASVYTHLEVGDQAAVIQSLPAPPQPEKHLERPALQWGRTDVGTTEITTYVQNPLPYPCQTLDTAVHNRTQTSTAESVLAILISEDTEGQKYAEAADSNPLNDNDLACQGTPSHCEERRGRDSLNACLLRCSRVRQRIVPQALAFGAASR